MRTRLRGGFWAEDAKRTRGTRYEDDVRMSCSDILCFANIRKSKDQHYIRASLISGLQCTRFEPVVLAFVRGLVATYATLSILGYGALLVNNVITTSATAITIQRSLVTMSSALATHNGVVFSPSANLWPRTFLVGFVQNIRRLTRTIDDLWK